VQAESEAQELHFMLLGLWENVRDGPTHPKWALTLGVGVPMDSQLF
jgi:hypothetical protein